MKKLLVAFFALTAASAWAQSGEFWFSAGESILSNRGIGSPVLNGTSNDVQLDNGFRFGFRFAFNTGEHIGHEIQYAYSRTDFVDNTGFLLGQVGSAGMAIHTGGYNFLYYATKEGSRIRPFATGGLHFNNYVPPGSSATSGGGSTKFGLNYGAGVKVNITNLLGVRFDVRQYETPKPDFGLFLRNGWLGQTEISAGIGVHF